MYTVEGQFIPLLHVVSSNPRYDASRSGSLCIRCFGYDPVTLFRVRKSGLIMSPFLTNKFVKVLKNIRTSICVCCFVLLSLVVDGLMPCFDFVILMGF
jgi:hypothetical protein